MALAKFFLEKYGITTYSDENPLVNQIAITITKLLNNDPDRLQYTVVNLSINNAFIGFDGEVSATHGIPLAANGGSVSLRADEDGALVRKELYGIAVGAAADIYIIITKGR